MMAKRREHEEKELEITTLLNVMVVLIAFLILTAVFSQVSVQELKLPAQAGGGATPLKPPVVVEVIIRKDSLQITNGKSVTDTIHNTNNKYDYHKLSESLLQLKNENKDKDDISVLVEPNIEYETLVAVMDAVKVAEIYTPGQEKPKKIVLFPQVSIGDAP
jgi:biopolymer transport protein ExbD